MKILNLNLEFIHRNIQSVFAMFFFVGGFIVLGKRYKEAANKNKFYLKVILVLLGFLSPIFAVFLAYWIKSLM